MLNHDQGVANLIILQFKNNADGLRYQKTNGLGYSTQYSFQADRSISNTASDTNGLVTRETDVSAY